MSMGEALANMTRAANEMAREIEALREENATLKRRIFELERPAVEAKRNEIRDSFMELVAAANETRDYEGAFNIECDLREREEQWKREDASSSPSLAAGDKRPETATEYAIRPPSGGAHDPTVNREAAAARLTRYRDMWPTAVLVQRTVTYGQWTEAV